MTGEMDQSVERSRVIVRLGGLLEMSVAVAVVALLLVGVPSAVRAGGGGTVVGATSTGGESDLAGACREADKPLDRKKPVSDSGGGQPAVEKKKKKKKGDGKTAAPEGKKELSPEGKPAVPEAPDWAHTEGPFSDFLWLARQMPDLGSFPTQAREVKLSIVAHRGQSLFFLDSCRAQPRKGGWRVEQCNAVEVQEKELLARLVKAGTDTAAGPESFGGVKALLKSLGKAKKRADLDPLLLESTVENPKGYRLADDIAGDLDSCGEKTYFKALAAMPAVTFVGQHVVVIDLEYTVEKGTAGSFRNRLSLVKGKDGWRIGGLQVHCFK